MVHIEDDGEFDAPLDRVWKYNADRETHQHRSIARTTVLEQEENVVLQEMEIVNPDGKGTHREVWRLTMNPPEGYSVEAVEGPAQGTTFSQRYVPKGDRTRVEVRGDWTIEGLDEATTKRMALAFLAEMFEEDAKALKSYR